jgi:hypothetical protein
MKSAATELTLQVPGMCPWFRPHIPYLHFVTERNVVDTIGISVEHPINILNTQILQGA